MNKHLLQDYLKSDEYAKTEYDRNYMQLISLLDAHLPQNIFFECEECLNFAILNKVEHAFLAGYEKGLQVCPKEIPKKS